ncbi:MAG: radical SAM family heme chaperone HemW [Candidatus Glassbacteria bacterium]
MTDSILKSPAHAGPIGIYVHVPFCRWPKCAYCDFYSVAWDETLARRLVDTVSREFAAALNDPFWRNSMVGSVFFGGGTPSLVGTEIISELIELFREELEFDHAAEITLECNPEDLDLSYADGLRRAGVNRLSVGCQSFDGAVLEALGRCHGARSSHKALETARAAGFERVSADLIIGCPGSSVESLANSVETALQLGVEHLSIYGYHLETGASGWGRKGYGPVEDEAFRGQYLAACECLARPGWRHYEISNWAVGDPALCRHNLGYWQRRPYLGLGPSAHSFIPPDRRRWNLPDLDLYLEAGSRGRWEDDRGGEILDPGQLALEKTMLGLRLDTGLTGSELDEFAGESVTAALGELEAEGLVRVGKVGGRVSLTAEGFLLYDSVVGRLAAGRKVSA